MPTERVNLLNDFIFTSAMGARGDEVQLIAFLNAVLKRTGKDRIESVEILEGKDLPAELAGGKAGKLDILAKLADGTKINVEIQLVNRYNMERRSLDYWAWNYIKGIDAGQDYSRLPAVIGINILGFRYIPLEDFHTSFHIYEDRHKEYQLTDALELHFLDTVRFRHLKDKDIVNDPLHRWLVYLDKQSPQNLIEEVLNMDPAIRKMQEKVDLILGDEAQLRAYLSYEKAASDQVTLINGAKREGRAEGKMEREREIAQRMKTRGRPLEEISEDTGLDMETIKRL
jgi:predicted transposase/invertase (TIGR01784 family)